MERKQNTQVVLLRRSQVDALQRIRDEESQRSGLGIKPSVHEVARQLVDKALKEIGR